MEQLTPEQMTAIFGPGEGNLAERARASERRFVRSQDEIAFYSEGATGLVMTARQVAAALPPPKLAELLHYGSAILSDNRDEPASSLRAQREALGLEQSDIASLTGLTIKAVTEAESPRKSSSIHNLAKIARALALDEFKLSIEPAAGADRNLAVRLRSFDKRLKPRGVLALAEAAWVIQQQTVFSPRSSLSERFAPSDIYGDATYPAWMHGRYLAQQTRKMLGLGDEPIRSMHRLIESLDIPVIQQSMPKKIAGATVNVGGARGIVANLDGENEKPAVRRFTFAHELGHLLWDPDQRLNSLRVDDFSEMESRLKEPTEVHDPVESRANAFAIEFLAPVAAVDRLFNTRSPSETLRSIMADYGVSHTAALHHLHNCTKFKGDLPRPLDLDDTQWRAAETPDYFPIKGTLDSRRGKFARRIVEAEKRGEIDIQTASIWLGCSPDKYLHGRELVLSMTS